MTSSTMSAASGELGLGWAHYSPPQQQVSGAQAAACAAVQGGLYTPLLWPGLALTFAVLMCSPHASLYLGPSAFLPVHF